MGKQIKSVVRGNAEFIMGAATVIAANFLANLGCGVLVCMFILSALVALATVKSSRYSKRGKLVIIAVVAIMLMSFGVYHKMNCHGDMAKSSVTATEEVAPEDKTEEEVVVEEAATVVVEDTTTKRGVNKGNNERIAVTKTNTEDLASGKTEVEGETIISFGEEDSSNDNDIIDQAKEDDSKEVTEIGDGIVTITEKVTDESDIQPQEDTTKVEIPEEVEEIVSEEANEKISEDETNTEEDFTDMSDEDLEDLFFETSFETITVVDSVIEIEDVEEEIETPSFDFENVDNQEVVNDEEVIEIEEEKTTDVVEEVVEETVVKEVAVEAIDGYTTTVGSQVQFKVSGDDVVIEGLDGIDYTFANGILTIDAGSEATVISVCVSNSVSAVNFDITVNGIIG